MDLEKLKKLVDNFRLRNIEVECFETLEQVKCFILKAVPVECTVGVGHSATLQMINISAALLERGNTVYDKELARNKEEGKTLKKKALLADWYITGSNAVSVDGRIVNVDHSGNRAAALAFGPDRVLVVVGKNKIVDTVEEAVKRVKNVACPQNAKRAGYNPPCVELDKCVDCVSKERVCNSLLVIEGQSECHRLKLCIVDEECGF